MKLRLSLVASTLVMLTSGAQAKNFPPDIANDVKSYGAKGDGVTDDTEAIRKALLGDRTPMSAPDYYAPRPRLVYFPPGTYLVSDTIDWLGCALQIQGSGDATIIKLKDSAPGFADKTKRKPVLRTQAGNYSFKEHVFDIVVDTGKGNPGAVGLDWISNNVGALRNVTVRSGDGSGVAGIDMTRAWPGPALIRDLRVEGFDYGIDVANAEYGPTFENLALVNQKIAAIRDVDNVLAIRKLLVDGAPVAIDVASKGAHVLLLDSTLKGPAGNPAIRNSGHVYLRNVTSSGYDTLLAEEGKTFASPIAEHVTGKIQQLFDSPQSSIGLPIAEVPAFHDDDLANWAKVDCAYQFCEDKYPAALASGKATVWLPHGVHLIGGKSFSVPKHVRRLLGFGSNINDYDDYGLTFVVEEDAPEPLLIEHFSNQLKVVHKGKRTVVVKSSDLHYTAQPGAGPLILDDVGMHDLVPAKGQSVWARQLNIEGDQLHVDNAGAFVWIFGLKSEGRGTIAKTSAGGWTEFLGTLLYPAGSFDMPGTAFINEESSHSLIFSASSYVDKGFYATLVDETRGGTKKTLPASALDGRTMPLFVGYAKKPEVGDGGVPPAPDAGSTPPPGEEAGVTSDAGVTNGDAPAEDEGGCGCTTAGRATRHPWLLGLLLLRRRRTNANAPVSKSGA